MDARVTLLKIKQIGLCHTNTYACSILFSIIVFFTISYKLVAIKTGYLSSRTL